MTPLAHALDLNFSYENTQHNLFESLQFSIHSQSRIGLIGDNGCGKSTLFHLLLGAASGACNGITCRPDLHIILHEQNPLDTSDARTIEEYLWMDKELWLAKLRIENPEENTWSRQDDDRLSYFLEKNGYEYAALIEKHLEEFHLAEIALDRPLTSLSGGELQKFSLLRLLLQKPELILLDEPTNHLDQEGQEWLGRFLNSIDVPFIIISHERKILDEVINETWNLKDRKLFCYPGCFSDCKNFLEQELEKKLHAYEVQKEKIEKLEKALEAKQNRAIELNKFRPERKRAKNGRILSRDTYKVKTCEIDSNLMRKAKAIETRISQTLEREKANKPATPGKKRITLPTSDIRSRYLIQVADLCFSWGDNTVIDNITFAVRPGEQLVLSGPNGCGKTTLLDLLCGNLQAHSGKISLSPQLKLGYLRQSSSLVEGGKPIRQILEDFSKNRQQRIFNLLGAFVFPREALQRTTEQLSPGERQKLNLALLLTSECNLLVLDEPTNYLEISSREALQTALLDFQGSLILTSHDAYLREAILSKDSALEIVLGK